MQELRGAAEFFLHVGAKLKEAEAEPYGPPSSAFADTHRLAGQACVALAGGDREKGRALWRQIVEDHGYMPLAAASALIRAWRAKDLVVPDEAPDPS